MNQDTILVENERKRLAFHLPLLICFAMFTAWQMGVVYFSGHTLSIDGGTPLPVDEVDTTVLIVIGYALSIAVMAIVPRIVVWTERITAAVALLCAVALFLPIPVQTLTTLYYIQCFACVFMIGFESLIIISLFSEETAIKHLLVAYSVVSILVAVVQNDFFQVPFPAFVAFTIAALTLMLVFFFRLPAKGAAMPRYVTREDGLVAPKSLFAGVLLLTGLSSFAALFGTGIAESVLHGVSVLYLSSAVCGIIVFLVWKKFRIAPFKSCGILVGITALGFVLAIAAQYMPTLSLTACVLLGAGLSLCWLNPLFGIMVAKRYPSRFVAPAIITISFIVVLVHAGLIDALRGNLTALYMVYLVISIALAVLYLVLEPYLLYSFRGRSVEEIVEAHNAAVEEETAQTREMPMQVQTVPPESEIRRKLRLGAIVPLTPREYEIAEMTVLGIKRQVIADALGIRSGTVNDHRGHVYAKFGASNREELLARLEVLSRSLPDRATQGITDEARTRERITGV
ncbi:MAG: helix-turn-helix transcriptional regulator [Propionibacteriaceae bacterium]|jgi:DNA-binding CsgD family transcriptional regulator|nr:helix-turn-helix transcriptional regulator [Propionibacteriaceae bacterium]